MTLELHFAIRDWAAVAPGLLSAPDWQAWARSPWCPSGHVQVDVEPMPALQRRRLNALGRMAAAVSYSVCDSVGCPTIFASRYGDASRSLELLAQLAQGEPVSPTAFGLSVHNAIGAMVSMARGDQANMLALAGGAATAAAGILEAASFLAEGVPEVLLVHYDAPLPPDYAHFQDEPAAAYAWAWRLGSSPQPGVRGFTLTRRLVPAGVDEVRMLPFGLALLCSVLNSDHQATLLCDDVQWTLQNHG